MSLIAAGIHDVGHPGTNPAFHTKTLSPLAVRYNDKSVLENFHVSLAFETMQKNQQCNWFALLPTEFLARDDPAAAPVNLQQYTRKGMISMVLATDMAKHPKHL